MFSILKDYIFCKLKKNWMVFEINDLGIFISNPVLWNDRVLIISWVIWEAVPFSFFFYKSNMTTNWKYIKNMARFKGSCLFKDPQAYRGVFFSNFSFKKTGDFHAWSFQAFTIYILYFPCIKNKYWIYINLHILYPPVFFDANSFSVLNFRTGITRTTRNKLTVDQTSLNAQ